MKKVTVGELNFVGDTPSNAGRTSGAMSAAPAPIARGDSSHFTSALKPPGTVPSIFNRFIGFYWT